MGKKKSLYIEYYGNCSDSSDEQDALFWSRCSAEEKFDAAWEIIKYYYESKGLVHELRFRRSVETVGEVEG